MGTGLAGRGEALGQVAGEAGPGDRGVGWGSCEGSRGAGGGAGQPRLEAAPGVSSEGFFLRNPRGRSPGQHAQALPGLPLREQVAWSSGFLREPARPGRPHCAGSADRPLSRLLRKGKAHASGRAGCQCAGLREPAPPGAAMTVPRPPPEHGSGQRGCSRAGGSPAVGGLGSARRGGGGRGGQAAGEL